MKKSLLSGFVAVMLVSTVAVGAGADSKGAQAVLLDGIAAYVNSEMITIADVMNEVRSTPWGEGEAESRERRLRELYKTTLDALIDRKLILGAAVKAKVQLQSWAVDNRVREIVANNFGGDVAKLHNLLAERRISQEEWKKGLEEDMLISAMRYQQIERRVSPTPREVRAEYDANRGRYQTEKAVTVSMIILEPTADNEGESVAARGEKIAVALKSGTAFAELAKQYSCDTKAAQGGSWGKVNPEDVFRSEIVEALAQLTPGESSPLIELAGYGYIVRKDEQQDSRLLSFEEAIPYVESHLRMQQGQKLYREWTERLRREAYIKIFELPSAQ